MLNWMLDMSDHPYVPSALLSDKQSQVLFTPDLLALESADISLEIAVSLCNKFFQRVQHSATLQGMRHRRQ
jgi:hypothetical protein